MNTYDNQNFKVPVESEDYPQASAFVIKSIEGILEEAIKNGQNKIILNTNLRNGLPMENINKIAGPIVEAWAGELFESIASKDGNSWKHGRYYSAIQKEHNFWICCYCQCRF